MTMGEAKRLTALFLASITRDMEEGWRRAFADWLVTQGIGISQAPLPPAPDYLGTDNPPP